uniref:Protein TsetseEP domain-containing protein n=1 Tax=Anopheles epiroticus TaxID=199890 RepID=A0A182P224_9DIPT
MAFSIVTLIVLSLLQCITAEPRPEFALSAPVPGKSRVQLAATEANNIISLIGTSTVDFTIRHTTLELLPKVFQIVKSVATDFQTLGTTVVTSITTLASDTSGNVDVVFGDAIQAVQQASAYADDQLPGLTQPLVQLIGTALNEKFEDSFKHIGKALLAIEGILNELKTGAQNALAAAGNNAAVTSTIISKNLKRSMITDLVKALQLLRGTVPVLKYTVDSTIEGIAIADQYMVDLEAAVTNAIGEKSSIAADMDGIIRSINSDITGTMATIGDDIGKLQSSFPTLTKVAAATSGPKILTALGDFLANLSELDAKTPTIQTVLNSLKNSVLDVYAIASPLFIIDESYLVDALITTLISNDNYSQYCFYKYKELFYTLLETVSIEARECVDKEVQRLDYFRETIDLMLDLLFYDYEDISGDLTVCNGINDAANLEECVSLLADIYTKLEEAFGDMFALGYDAIERETTPQDESGLAMMRLLAFALCVQSLSQLLPSAHAKPDFGLKLPIKSSGKVSAAVLNAQNVLVAADDNTPFTAEVNFKGLQELANIMTRVATELVSVGNELVPIVTNLVTDVSGDVGAVFTTVFDKITATKEAITTKLPVAIDQIKELFKNNFSSENLDYIPNQLNDGFRRVRLGLDDLAAKLQALKTAIAAAETEASGAGELTDALVKKHVKPAFVYDVVFSINQLKAYLPVIKYTIDSTLENINLADDYLKLVQEGVANADEASKKAIDSVKSVTDAITKEVKDDFTSLNNQFQNTENEVETLTKINQANYFINLVGVLSSFSESFYKLETERYPSLETQLEALIDTLSKALSGEGASGQLSSPLLDSLILTVIENGKYAQFCFYKYLELVFGLLTSLVDSSRQCLDKEISRLQYLQETLALIRDIFAYDFESLSTELAICDMITNTDKLNQCVQKLTEFYHELAITFGLKVQYMFELIETESVASTNRFLICIELVKLNLIEFTETGLINDIRECAKDGPTADD